MYISIVYNIINRHARVFYEKKKKKEKKRKKKKKEKRKKRKKKKKNEPRPSEHPPVVGGKNKHRIHGKLGIQLSF